MLRLRNCEMFGRSSPLFFSCSAAVNLQEEKKSGSSTTSVPIQFKFGRERESSQLFGWTPCHSLRREWMHDHQFSRKKIYITLSFRLFFFELSTRQPFWSPSYFVLLLVWLSGDVPLTHQGYRQASQRDGKHTLRMNKSVNTISYMHSSRCNNILHGSGSVSFLIKCFISFRWPV